LTLTLINMSRVARLVNQRTILQAAFTQTHRFVSELMHRVVQAHAHTSATGTVAAANKLPLTY